MLRGWMDFNDPSKVDGDIEDVAPALKIAGSSAATRPRGALPRGQDPRMPDAWEFDIEFDEKTGHVKRVVQGDNSKYQQYIEAQNQATDMSREAVKRLIPAAEKTGVIIALENVWNNLWVKPGWRRTSSPRSTAPGCSPISTSATT